MGYNASGFNLRPPEHTPTAQVCRASWVPKLRCTNPATFSEFQNSSASPSDFIRARGRVGGGGRPGMAGQTASAPVFAVGSLARVTRDRTYPCVVALLRLAILCHIIDLRVYLVVFRGVIAQFHRFVLYNSLIPQIRAVQFSAASSPVTAS